MAYGKKKGGGSQTTEQKPASDKLPDKPVSHVEGKNRLADGDRRHGNATERPEAANGSCCTVRVELAAGDCS